MTNEEAQKILEELQSGKTVDSDKLREFFTAVAKEAKSAGKEVIPFEVMDTRYVLYAPLNSMCILAEIDVINKATEESTLHLLMMSVNMEHVNKLLELLRQKDPATVDAVDYVIQNGIIYGGDVSFVLCYDFPNKCPYVEICKKQWCPKPESLDNAQDGLEDKESTSN